MSYIPIQLLIDAQTATATIPKTVSAVGSARDLTFTVTGNGTTSGGTVIIEESDDPSYTGTWGLLYTQLASGVTGNQKLPIHIRVGAGLFTRPRITGAITGGGTISVSVTGA